MAPRCTHCNFQNPPGMRFCGNCGARLAESEAPIAANLAETSSPVLIPEKLGVLMGADLVERLQRAGLESSGQRRKVTVLFADLSGYTELSERLDPEDLYMLVQEYIQVLSDNIYKYEGIIDKLTGDGLMALFGAPIAHENNAERAVRAALDMQADILCLSKSFKEKTGADLNMRIGLHSGTVIVGGIGSNLMMDYTAIGDTVNLAHRIEEAAAPGTILISESVYRQVRAVFDCQQISVLNPKGIARPIFAYRVLGPKARPGDLRGIEGLRAPMIGREAELNLLNQAVADLAERNTGQFILITGEAGIGKSRLKAEFITNLGQYKLRLMEGQGQAYRRSIPYWIFLEILYSYLGLSPAAPEIQVRERLILNVYQANKERAEEILPFLEHLLSLPYTDEAALERLRYLDAEQLRQGIFLAVRDLLLAEARQRPVLLIVEDLHWADSASLYLLQFLLESVRQAPLFILAIARHTQNEALGKLVDRADLILAHRFQLILLQQLSPNQIESLLFELLLIPNIPKGLRQQILERSSGIPFYLEEILRMLIDEGAIQRKEGQWWLVPGAESLRLGVPETLKELILARFDRLGGEQKRILQVAAVIGNTFAMTLLEAVISSESAANLSEIIPALVEREFILPKSGEPENEYTFRHILMSEAIYETLLKRECKLLHGQVGEAIEFLYPDRLDGQIELLANHYCLSSRLDRALHFLILAGEKAVRNNLHEQARQHYQAALELLPLVDRSIDQAIKVLIGLGDTEVFLGDYSGARNHYQEALLTILDGYADWYQEESIALYRKIARTYERQGDYEQALAHLEKGKEALSLAACPLPVECAQVWNDIGWIHFRRGDFPEAQRLLKEALELVEDSDAYDAIASIYNRLGGVAYNLGDWEGAASFLRKSIAMREAIHDMAGLATSFNNLGLLETEMGEFNSALENLTRSYELKTNLGQAEGRAMALTNLGSLRLQRGELEQAEQAFCQALELARQIGYSSLLRQINKNFGELYLAAQDWEKACQALGETALAFMDLGANDQLLDTYRLLGEAALGSGDLSGAQAWADKAAGLLESPGSEGQKLSAVQRGELWRFRGMLANRLGDRKAAWEALRESEAIFMKLRSRYYLGKTALQMGTLSESQGDHRSARIHFREAALLFQSVGAKLDEQRALSSTQ